MALSVSSRLQRGKGTIGANYTYLAVGQLVRMALSFVLLSVVGRFLAVEQFGIFSYALVFAELFYAVAEFGLPAILTREIARAGGKGAASYYAVTFALQWGFGSAAFACIAIVSYLEQGPNEGMIVTWIMGLTVIFGVALKVSQSVFRAFERMEFDAAASAIERLITLVLVVVVVELRGTLIQMAVAYSLGSLVAAVLAFCLVQTLFVRLNFTGFSIGLAKQVFALALPLAAGTVFSILKDRIGFVLLEHLRNAYAVGIFSAGYRLVIPLFAIGSLLGTVLIPVFSRQSATSADIFAKSYSLWTKVSLLVGIGVQILIWRLAQWLVPLVFNDQYISAIPVISVLSFGLIFSLGHFVATTALLAMREMRALFLASSNFL